MNEETPSVPPPPMSPAPETALSTGGRAPEHKLLSTGILITASIKIYREHYSTFLAIGVIPLIAAAVRFVPKIPGALLLVLTIVSYFVTMVFMVALYQAIARGGVAGGGMWETYREAARKFFPFFWISILSGMAAWGGFVLLIVPGIIISILLGLSAFTFLAEDRRGLSALSQSWHYVRGYTAAVFGRSLLMGLAMMGALIPFFLLVLLINVVLLREAETLRQYSGLLVPLLTYLVAIPISAIFTFLIYQQLKEIKGAPSPEEERKIKKRLKIFIWLGLLTILAAFTIGLGVVIPASRKLK